VVLTYSSVVVPAMGRRGLLMFGGAADTNDLYGVRMQA
jgi:hypothetical protein